MKIRNIVIALILMAIPAGIVIAKTANKEPAAQPEVHALTEQENRTETGGPVGYCGNTQTTLYFEDGTSKTFDGSDSVWLTHLLRTLDYKPENLCKCLPEYKVDTEFAKGYGLSLSYARCDKGQASLTKEQSERLEQIIEKVKRGELF